MDIRTKFTVNIPEALIEALGINEETIFVVNYENGKLTIEPILEIYDEDDENTFDIEAENDAWYEEGYEEGHVDGYAKGYGVGYDDAENGREFDDTYPEDEAECDGDCDTCSFYDAANDICRVRNDE